MQLRLAKRRRQGPQNACICLRLEPAACPTLVRDLAFVLRTQVAALGADMWTGFAARPVYQMSGRPGVRGLHWGSRTLRAPSLTPAPP
jgi:hypothetical protein